MMRSITAPLFKYVWRPPLAPLTNHDLDYGHGYLYEPLFCQDSSDIQFLLRLCLQDPHRTRGVFDLGGGTGRVAVRLASEKIPTTLLDRSASMLALAKDRCRSTPGERYLTFQRQEIQTCSFNRRFQWIFSINHGFEHLGPETEIVSALKNVRQYLHQDGRLIIDVHNPEYWMRLPHWGKCHWAYWDSPWIQWRARKHPAHIWTRTTQEQGRAEVLWEHAIAFRSLRYRHLATQLHLYPVEIWHRLFRQSNYSIENQWGDWRMSDISPQTPKMLFVLKSASNFSL